VIICVFEENIPVEITGHIHDLVANMIKNFKVQKIPANFSNKDYKLILRHVKITPDL